MKLQLQLSGNGGKTTEINIRNPKAQVSNLRAAVAISLKLDSRAFRLSHPTAGALDDDTATLTAIGFKDDDVITVAMKRDRDDDDGAPKVASDAQAPPPKPSAAAAKSTAASQSSPPTGIEAVSPSPALVQQLTDMGFPVDKIPQALIQAHNDLTRASELLLGGMVGPVVQPNSASPSARQRQRQARMTNLGGLGGSDEDEEDDEDWEDMEEDDDIDDEEEEDFDDDEEAGNLQDILAQVNGGNEEEGREQAQIVTLLTSIFPDGDQLAADFDANPRAVMTNIQQNHPELFSLIARHHAFFLDFVRAVNDEEEEGSSFSDDGDEGGVADTSGLATTTTAAPTTTTAAAPTTAAEDRTLTDRDNANIDSLMQLGFPRDRVTEAYFKFGRNPDRAATWLFDNPQ